MSQFCPASSCPTEDPGGFHRSPVTSQVHTDQSGVLTSASHCPFASVSPGRTGAWAGEVRVAWMQRGRGSAAGGVASPSLLGQHAGDCHNVHLLHLSAAQGPSLQQETIAFPLASPTLGKLPRQPAEQISGASRAGTEPLLRRAVLERLGFAAWRPTCPWLGANPPQHQASCVSCTHGAACWGSHGARDQGMLARRAASPAPGCRGAGPASEMERRHGGSQRAGMACIPAAVPVPGDDARWPGDWCVG